jgi:hypothetical protein
MAGKMTSAPRPATPHHSGIVMQPPARLVVTPNGHPFFRTFGSPVVEIDGAPQPAAWGAPSAVALAQGRHRVRVYFNTPAVGWSRGVAETAIDLAPGEAVELAYTPPVVIPTWLSGTLTRLGPQGQRVALVRSQYWMVAAVLLLCALVGAVAGVVRSVH